MASHIVCPGDCPVCTRQALWLGGHLPLAGSRPSCEGAGASLTLELAFLPSVLLCLLMHVEFWCLVHLFLVLVSFQHHMKTKLSPRCLGFNFSIIPTRLPRKCHRGPRGGTHSSHRGSEHFLQRGGQWVLGSHVVPPWLLDRLVEQPASPHTSQMQIHECHTHIFLTI